MSRYIALFVVSRSIKKLFFLYEFSLTDTGDSQDYRRREGSIFYSTLPFPPFHEHLDIYLQLWMWDDYHVIFNRTPDCYSMRITTLLDYYLVNWWWNFNFFVCLVDDLVLGFCYSNLTRETCGFELLLTIILVLQAKRLIQCGNHP